MGDQLFDMAAVPHVLSLAERFVLPPFTVLDARSGWWQNRKRLWVNDIGIQSELGRDAKTFAKGNGDDDVSQKILALSGGQSVFDPVLTELAYRWFCPPDGTILDPFAGGSVRGVVAGYLGNKYIGIDLAETQIIENRRQADLILTPPHDVKWVSGDSAVELDNLPSQSVDFVFSCPPYHDLEVYSKNPVDISAMKWPQFLTAYQSIITKSVSKLAQNRFAMFVVGEFRHGSRGVYRGFLNATIDAFESAGANYYNELVLVQPVGTLPIRAARQFKISRKLGRTHQTALIFVKGDPKLAAEKCGDVVVAEDLANIDMTGE